MIRILIHNKNYLSMLHDIEILFLKRIVAAIVVLAVVLKSIL